MNNVEFVERCRVLAIIAECQKKIDDARDYDICESPSSQEGAKEAVNYILKRINDIPTINVPERHGEWHNLSLDDQDEGMYVCSECKAVESMPFGDDYDYSLYEYCPHCGAKMDGNGKSDWIATSEQLPPENQIVDTKVEDEKGLRNEQQLIFSNNLWWLPDKSMYVYYTPTHWNIAEKDGSK